MYGQAGDINVAGDIATGYINRGSDSAADTVTREPGDQVQGNSCNGDAIRP